MLLHNNISYNLLSCFRLPCFSDELRIFYGTNILDWQKGVRDKEVHDQQRNTSV